ncbi:MAG: dehydrogenase E1 component subunit alpha/beta [Chlamydiota bacterium]
MRSLLESLLIARYTDEKMSKLVRQNKGGSFHLDSRGHELIGILSAKLLQSGTDWAFPYYRDRSFPIGLGAPLIEIFSAFLAKDSPHHSSGRMMPDHFCHPAFRIPVQSSVVGSQFLQATGLAQAIKLQGKKEVVYVSSGEGGTSQGDFHEAMNYASLRSLPVLFVIQDNGWAISVRSEEQTTGGCVSNIASGYPNMAVHLVDGTKYVETAQALSTAIRRAREEKGPSTIIAKIPRIGAHSSSDDHQKYKTDQEIQEDLARDPLPAVTKWALGEGYLDQNALEALQDKALQEVERAVAAAEKVAKPSPKKVAEHLFSPYSPPNGAICTKKALQEEPVVMVDALNEALVEEMEADPSVLVFGQDVAKGKGGVFGVTRALTERFGESRCFNTPLAESTIVGLAIGLGLSGAFRPVAEIQFCDYSWTAMNQIINELSSIHYRSSGLSTAPVTIRMPYGAYIQGGPYHSQRIEAIFAHCPGLKVVIPSNAADAKSLMKTAIRDPNPVIFLEHKALYRQRVFSARALSSVPEYLPFGQANIVQTGSDLTLITYGMMTFLAADVATKLQKEGISCEIIDLRTIVPLDKETLSKSVRKTGKVCILQEAPLFAGVGAEIAAIISSEDFCYLDAPIVRLGALDLPIPYAKELEEAVLPSKASIEKAIRRLHAY